jgi:hypothetical protein
MSTTSKTGIALLVALLVGWATTGTAVEHSALAGNYSLVCVDGRPIPYAPMHEGQSGIEVTSGTITLQGDGTFVSAMGYGKRPVNFPDSRDFKGTYTQEEDGLMLTWDGAGRTRVTLYGNVIVMDNHGTLFVYARHPKVSVKSSATREDLPELQVLSNYTGEWDAAFTSKDTSFTSSRQSAKWILDGRVLQRSGSMANEGDTDRLDFTALYAYDPQSKIYRSWYFDSTGHASQSEGTWDEKKKTMTFIGQRDEQTVTSQDHFSKDNVFEWAVITTNQAGDVIRELSGKNTRHTDPSTSEPVKQVTAAVK